MGRDNRKSRVPVLCTALRLWLSCRTASQSAWRDAALIKAMGASFENSRSRCRSEDVKRCQQQFRDLAARVACTEGQITAEMLRHNSLQETARCKTKRMAISAGGDACVSVPAGVSLGPARRATRRMSDKVRILDKRNESSMKRLDKFEHKLRVATAKLLRYGTDLV